MTLYELLEKIPDVVKLIGGWITGGLTVLGAIIGFRSKRRNSKNRIIKEYKQLYIDTAVELINATKSGAKKDKILTVMEQKCKECYDEAIEKLDK